MQAFRRRVLDMSHVEVETSAVEEKSSISWRFLVVAVMQVDRASIRRSEQIIFNLGRPQLRIDVRFFFTQKTAVFGFDSNDPIHCRQLTHRIAIWLSEKTISPHLESSPKNRERRIPVSPAQYDANVLPVLTNWPVQLSNARRLASPFRKGRGLR